MSAGAAGRRRALLRPPILRSPDEERHPTWLELFFDLCFVAAVAALAAYLHHHASVDGLLLFAVLFVPVWWAWMGYSWYASAFDNDDVVFRVSWLAAMLLVIALAAGVGPATDGRGDAFALTYGLLMALLALLFARAARHERAARRFAVRYAAGDALGAALWFASLGVDEPARYAVWVAAMVVLMATPPFAVRAYAGKAFNAAHIAERYGLFTIIVLGESVVAVGASLADSGFDLLTAVTAALGFGVAAALWWVYFDSVRWSPLTRASLLRSFTWGYGHLFVFAGIAAAAVGVHLAAEAAQHDEALGAVGRLLLFGGAGAFLLATAVIHAITVRGGDRVLAGRLVALVAVAAGGALAGSWPAPATVGVLLAVAVAVVVHETLLGDVAPSDASPSLGA
jgi:low temperature requirement protein LtrA